MLPMERMEPFEAIERIESSDAIDQRDDVVFPIAASYAHLEVHTGGALKEAGVLKHSVPQELLEGFVVPEAAGRSG